MEKSRSLIWQVIGYKMLFVVFLLFLTDILVEVVVTTKVTTHVAERDRNISTSPFPASSQMTEESSNTSVTSPPDATTPDTLNRSLITPVQPTLSLNAALPVSKQESSMALTPLSTPGQPALSLNAALPVSKQESSMALTTAVPEQTSSPMRSEVTVSTKEEHLPTEATELQKFKSPIQKEVPSAMTVTPHFYNETVSSPTKDLGTTSQGSFFEKSPGAIAYPETTKSTEPKDDRKGPMPPSQAVPELTQTPETGSHYVSGPFTTSVIPINDAPISDTTDKKPSERKNSVIILAVVFSILLLVGLLVFLYFRRRRHSGSTSFNSPEWAGQVTLPDDTGLDKDMEQQKLRTCDPPEVDELYSRWPDNYQ